MVSASFSYNLVYFCNKSQNLEVPKALLYAHKRLFSLRSARRKCALITGLFVANESSYFIVPMVSVVSILSDFKYSEVLLFVVKQTE